MMKKHRFYIPFFILFFFIKGFSQPDIDPRYISGFWEAHWITHPTASPTDYGVYHFRKEIDIDKVPAEFVVHVSGDNRYRLLINGVEVALGPARGDLEHWRFETVDIAPKLKPGKNIIGATVWNSGLQGPAAQISLQTAFILQGNGDTEQIINTDRSWKVLQDMAYLPEQESYQALHTYIVVGPGDKVDAAKYPWGWEQQGYDDEDWEQVKMMAVGQTYGLGTDGDWRLVPRDIPPMDKYPVSLQSVRIVDGLTDADALITGDPLVVAPHQKVTILLDQEQLVTAYPRLETTGGRGAEIKISYAEALFDKQGQKGNRNEVDGKFFRGYSDYFYPDGGASRIFRPLWFRTWRYLQLEITTGADALKIIHLDGEYTGYPLVESASFQSDQKWLEDVWEVGWRTARLCAGETYFDCPYYEQLQYVGDTRIQALISLYVAGDARLMRKAINDFEQSRIYVGLTQSRYPCGKLQIIPPYSLFWIAMIYDYWMHQPDFDYVKSLLPGIQAVLRWYESELNAEHLLKRTKWWQYVDWTDEWSWDPVMHQGGVPEQDDQGNSLVLTLHYTYALQLAEKLHRAFNEDYYADHYADQLKEIKSSLFTLGWDAQKGLFRDLPKKDIYSQHANILAILCDVLPEGDQGALMKRILENPGLIQATFYFKFYLFQALVKTGMADQYLAQIKPWRDMLNLGLTTFAEKPDPTRSDCHAWSASPNYDLLATVAGIRPSAPGFSKISVSPSFGELTEIEAKMPHPQGEISVSLQRDGDHVHGSVSLPASVSGVFSWKGGEMMLKSGVNQIDL
ncbi:MAG: alpha-L-rhamnosidase N-terminal domain-containing protein [Saprospiraceae bacterium]|nr:alpha-L-rhamnosidase N-terminal domain-containing protein [Saprospiraceae bacterium]